MEHRVCGDADITTRDSDAAPTQDVNYEAREGQGVAVATGTVTEKKWSELSNLQVAGDNKEIAYSQPSSSSSAGSNRHTIRRISSYAHLKTSQDDGEFSKSSLSFILDDQTASAAVGDEDFTSGGKIYSASITRSRSRSTGDLTRAAMVNYAMALEDTLATEAQSGHICRSSGKQSSTDGKRRARRPPSRICKHESCEQYVVDQGLCVRHGGGKRCQTLGCTSRAKHQGRCWKHGGSTECKIPRCINRAKSRGFCSSHGGGTKCKAESCEKIAISNGLCWAHGGGKRCVIEGCMRQAYERTANLCNNHYQER